MAFPLPAFLKKRWKLFVSDLNTEFYGYVGELLEHDDVMRLDDFTHHYGFTRLRHSLDVAYASFVISKLLRWDSRSVARAGLLHDLFFYDRRAEDYVPEGRRHASGHPKAALVNAKRITDLNKVEENIILRHMWLATLVPPRYKEGYIVTLMDKCCAAREFSVSLFTRSQSPRAVTASNW